MQTTKQTTSLIDLAQLIEGGRGLHTNGTQRKFQPT